LYNFQIILILDVYDEKKMILVWWKKQWKYKHQYGIIKLTKIFNVIVVIQHKYQNINER